ncbi:hypothetical protein, partial [Actinoplanes regularis]|uniref:hypothetical protein n=1 Tax=Actinoplanes regularis TaxID=52697 RepID=UPI001942DA83
MILIPLDPAFIQPCLEPPAWRRNSSAVHPLYRLEIFIHRNDKVIHYWQIRVAAKDDSYMRQLQLFTTAQLSTMRDRTKRRNYSAEADEFRREHEKRRAWGLTQRHARKLHRVYGHIPADEEIKARWNERIAAASTCRRPEPDPPPNSEAAIAKPPHPEAAIA